jgi:hypothetical protein
MNLEKLGMEQTMMVMYTSTMLKRILISPLALLRKEELDTHKHSNTRAPFHVVSERSTAILTRYNRDKMLAATALHRDRLAILSVLALWQFSPHSQEPC